MPYKITVLFEDTTGIAVGGGPTGATRHVGGWSESVYTNNTDLTNIRARLLTPGAWGQGLLPARAQLLPQTATTTGYRLTQVLPRQGKAQSAGAVFPGAAGNTDVPQMALQCSAPGVGVSNVRHFTIRAIPDSQVINGEYLPSFGFLTAVNNYFTELTNWRFLGQDLTLPFFQLQTITDAGLLTATNILPYVPGDLIQLSGVKSDSDGQVFSGKFYVLSLGPLGNQLTLRDWPSLNVSGGKCRKVSYLLHLMDTGITADRIVVRKVGRPFDLYRGRKSKSRALGV